MTFLEKALKIVPSKNKPALVVALDYYTPAIQCADKGYIAYVAKQIDMLCDYNIIIQSNTYASIVSGFYDLGKTAKLIEQSQRVIARDIKALTLELAKDDTDFAQVNILDLEDYEFV